MAMQIVWLLLVFFLGGLLGIVLSWLIGGEAASEPDLDALRDAYEEGLLHGHLATVGGSFERREIGARAGEWLLRKIDDGNRNGMGL
jgi:hypothetical protein